MICEDRKREYIACELRVSRSRANQLVTSIYDKAGVRTMMELLRWAIRTGIVEA